MLNAGFMKMSSDKQDDEKDNAAVKSIPSFKCSPSYFPKSRDFFQGHKS